MEKRKKDLGPQYTPISKAAGAKAMYENLDSSRNRTSLFKNTITNDSEQTDWLKDIRSRDKKINTDVGEFMVLRT